jgi:hypothetical protein
MTTRFWLQTVDGDWSDASRWSGALSSPPSAGDDVELSGNDHTVMITGPFQAVSLTLGNISSGSNNGINLINGAVFDNSGTRCRS